MAADLRAYWAVEPAALIEALGSGPGGLSTDAAAVRRAGTAGLPASAAGGPRRLLLRQLQSPLVLILVAGASVSLVVREWVDAAIILAIVLGSVALGFLQEYRASRAVAALRSQLALRVRVVRDGREQVVPAPDVLPGDIVLLAAGNSSDRVDAPQLAVPCHWSLRDVRRFMPVFGLLSTVFDLATFAVLLRGFDADQATFQTTWFVVSLLTELVVVLSLRTSGPAWRTTPSRALVVATAFVGTLAVTSPYLGGLSRLFGLVPLPLMIVMLVIVAGYLLATEVAKYWFYRRYSRLY